LPNPTGGLCAARAKKASNILEIQIHPLGIYVAKKDKAGKSYLCVGKMSDREIESLTDVPGV
jgi:hypothetical protein